MDINEENCSGNREENEDAFSTDSTLSTTKQASIKTKKRKVSFPDEAHIVSKSVEPENPWKNGKKCTKENM